MHIGENNSVQSYECDGSWKVTGCNHGNTSWHSGRAVFVRATDGIWMCQVYISGLQNPNKTIRLNGRHCGIKKVHAKSRLMIDLSDGTSIHMSALPAPKLSELDKLLTSIKNGRSLSPGVKSTMKVKPVSPVTQCSTPNFGRKKNSLEFSSINHFQTNNSPSILSNMKNLVSPRSHSTDENQTKDDFELVEEAYVKSEYQKIPRRRLIVGNDENMSPIRKLSTDGFYGNQGSEMRSFSATASSSSSTGKRRPGLMPMYPEMKRAKTALSPSVSNVKYSWQKLPSNASNLQGFSNLGNTCYMNAILQSLFTLDCFASDLIKVGLQAKKRFSDDELHEKFFRCLSRLLYTRWHLYTTLDQRRTCLAAVKRAISSTARRFLGHEQHDAHEFLSLVLDQLKEEVIAMNRVGSEVTSSGVTPPGVSKGDESNDLINPTAMNFEFEVIHIITCLGCQEQVTKSETFHDLSLDLPRQNGDPLRLPSLQESLDQFLCREPIEHTCAKCNHNRAEVDHKFTRLPRVLVLHLKRYNFIAATSYSSKMGRPISIPRFLTLQDHCMEDTLPSYPAPEPYRPSIHNDKTDSKHEGDSMSVNDTSPQRHPPQSPQIGIHPRTPPSTEKRLSAGGQSTTISTAAETVTDENNNDTTKSQNVSDMSETKQVDYLLDYTRKQSEHDKQKLHEFRLDNLSEDEQMRIAMQQSIEHMNNNSGNHDNSNRDDTEVCRKCGRRPYFLESVGEHFCDCTHDVVNDSQTDIFDMHCSKDAPTTTANSANSEGRGHEEEEEDKENRTPPPPPPPVDPLMGHSDWSDSQAIEHAIANSLKDQEIRELEQRKLNSIECNSVAPLDGDITDDDDERLSPRSPQQEKLIARNAETGELGYSYRLMSVVSHLGSSSVVGHYISDVCDIKKRAWFSYDDTEVTRLREAEVRERRQRTGYIFFYVAKEIVDDLRDWYEAQKDNSGSDRTSCPT